jgi:secreted trypsin-like serine protease
MYLLSQLNIFFLLFTTILSNTPSYEYDKINQQDPIQHSWSMLVSLRYDYQRENNPVTHFCVGTILTDSYILTTAECVDSLPSDATIVVDIHSQSKSGQVSRKVNQIIIHPNWKNDRNSMKHNIALLHLTNSLDFTVNKHITLTYNLSNSTRLLVIDWNSPGKGSDATMFDSLQQTDVYLVDNNDPICNRLVHDVEQQFCARLYHNSKSLF